ncbi:MAG: hypothetical protein GY756_22810 [bacterium]|nr:hypothetical protein [bacterium]
MPKYKSRINNVGKLTKSIPTKKRISNTGGSVTLGKLLKRSAPKVIKNFANQNPKIAMKIANGILKHAERGHKGGNFARKAASGILLLGTGAAAGAVGFREYLIRNPAEAAKLTGTAISAAAKGFLGGAGLVSGGSLRSGGDLRSGGGFVKDKLKEIKERSPTITKKVMDATKKAQGKVSGGLRKVADHIDAVDLSKIKHNVMSHVINHATPHEFNIIRGITSRLLKTPHPMDNYLKKHLTGVFDIPKHIHKEALRDILRAPSQHFLAEMIHSEGLDKHKGKDVGGGLLDSIKHIGKKAFNGVKKFSRKSVSAGNSINKMFLKGLLIAQMLEPIATAISPEMGALLKSGLATASKIQKGLGTVVGGAEVVNKLLHGDIEVILQGVGQKFGSKAESKIKKDIENIEKRGDEEKQEGIAKLLADEQDVIERVGKDEPTPYI